MKNPECGGRHSYTRFHHLGITLRQFRHCPCAEEARRSQTRPYLRPNREGEGASGTRLADRDEHPSFCVGALTRTELIRLRSPNAWLILNWSESTWDGNVREGVPLLIHQPSYSMLNRWVEKELLGTLEELGVGCIAFSPLAQGLLTNKYLNGVPDSSRANDGLWFQKQFLSEENLKRVQALNPSWLGYTNG